VSNLKSVLELFAFNAETGLTFWHILFVCCLCHRGHYWAESLLASGSDSAHCYTFLRSMVCLSFCRLSHSCTLLKPFDGFRCHSVCTLAGSSGTLCYICGSLTTQGKKIFGKSNPRQNRQLPVLCCHLANANELGGLAKTIPPFIIFVWFFHLGRKKNGYKPGSVRVVCLFVGRSVICLSVCLSSVVPSVCLSAR